MTDECRASRILRVWGLCLSGGSAPAPSPSFSIFNHLQRYLTLLRRLVTLNSPHERMSHEATAVKPDHRRPAITAAGHIPRQEVRSWLKPPQDDCWSNTHNYIRIPGASQRGLMQATRGRLSWRGAELPLTAISCSIPALGACGPSESGALSIYCLLT